MNIPPISSSQGIQSFDNDPKKQATDIINQMQNIVNDMQHQYTDIPSVQVLFQQLTQKFDELKKVPLNWDPVSNPTLFNTRFQIGFDMKTLQDTLNWTPPDLSLVLKNAQFLSVDIQRFSQNL